MLLRALVIWFALLVIASANGFVREAVLIPRMGDVAGRAVSSISLSALILGLSWWSIAWIAPSSFAAAWRVGIIWVLLTLAFEFLAGHYLFHNPWERLRGLRRAPRPHLDSRADHDARGAARRGRSQKSRRPLKIRISLPSPPDAERASATGRPPPRRRSIAPR